MLLKRNLLTILYSFIFIVFFGIGFVQVAYMSILGAENTNFIACIIVFSILIFLIASFFIKESQKLNFFQKETPLLIVVEAILVVASLGGMFYLNLFRGMEHSILLTLLLASIYLCGRQLGGRFCGLFSVVMGFLFLLTIANIALTTDQYINTLCFLIPYALFLFVSQTITRVFYNRGFLLVSSYFLLAVLFSLAIMINPLTCILLIGCAFSLIFGKAEKTASVFSKGVPASAVLVVFTAILVVFANAFIKEIFSFIGQFELDSTIVSCMSLESLGKYLLDKYQSAVKYLHYPFEYGILPSLLLFLGCVSGYYSMCKKFSGIGPLCLTYINVLIMYLAFGSYGGHFYYLTYFLPIFAAYGLYSSLYSQKQVVSVSETDTKAPENTTPESDEATPAPVLAQEEKTSEEEEEIIVAPKDKGAIPEWSIPVSYQEKKEEPTVEVASPEPAVSEPAVSESVISETEISEPAPEPVNEMITSGIPEEPDENVLDDVSVLSKPEEDTLTDTVELTEAPKENDVLETSTLEEDNNLDFLTDVDSHESDMLLGSEDEDMEDDAQLNTLLNRLDISDNIRRMNESAREDIADVIEHNEEELNLAEVVPSVIVEAEEPEEELSWEEELLPEEEPLEVIAEEPEFDMPDSIELEVVELEAPPEPEIVELEFMGPEEEEVEEVALLPKYEKPDFEMEPVTSPIPENPYSAISEYDEVPTVENLVQKWTQEEEAAAENKSGFAFSLDDIAVSSDIPTSEPVIETEKEPVREMAVHSEPVVRKNGVRERSYHRITIK